MFVLISQCYIKTPGSNLPELQVCANYYMSYSPLPGNRVHFSHTRNFTAF